MDKIIFKSKSRLNNFSFYVWLVLCVGLIGYLVLHFQDNPTIISIIVLVLLFIALANSRDFMIVRESEFEIVFDRLFPLLSTSKKIIFSEIDNIEADLPLTEKTGILSDVITAFGPFPMLVNNTLTINYKDGRTKKFSTNIYRDAFHEGFRHIGKLADLKIVVNNVPFS